MTISDMSLASQETSHIMLSEVHTILKISSDVNSGLELCQRDPVSSFQLYTFAYRLSAKFVTA